MNKFTFAVFTCNQEKLILETLESIKFQKKNYGENIDVNLILADDASKDKTVQLTEKWVAENRMLFSEVTIIANQKNVGTVANYCNVMSLIHQENFKIIAGDDLIGRTNLFAEYDNLDDRTIKTYARIYLKNGKIFYDEKDLIAFCYHQKQKKTQSYNVRNMRRGCYFHTPSTLFSKELFEKAQCAKHLADFKLFEDDPSWYLMLKNNPELRVDFLGKGIVLYRLHDKAVSNAPNRMFQEDIRKLRTRYLDDTVGFEHMYLRARIHDNVPKYLRFDKYVDKAIYWKRKIAVINDPDYRKLKQQIEKQVNEEQAYYDSLLCTLENHG